SIEHRSCDSLYDNGLWMVFNDTRMLSAFFVGYLTTQILGGALADKFGGKPVLAIERSRANAVVTGSSAIGAVVGLPHGRLGSGIYGWECIFTCLERSGGVRDLHSNAGMNQLLYLANNKNDSKLTNDIPWMSILSKKEVWTLLINITLALTSRNWDILLSFAGTIGDHMIHKVKFRVITIRRIAQSIGSFGAAYCASSRDKLTIGMGLNAFTLILPLKYASSTVLAKL
ncbi:10042_t:CDS:2, partial [Funneliformis mosseae]